MIKFKKNFTDKQLVIGLTGVIIAFLSGAILFMSSIPWLGISDTALNLDYSWQVHNGDLPNFYEGPKAPIDVKMLDVQYVSHHPPLYYAIISVVSGPLIDSGSWRKAAFAAGVVTILIGLLCLISFAWAGWVYGKQRKRLFAVAVPAILTSLPPFILVAGSIFNDTLALLFASIAIVLLAIVIRRGMNLKYALILAFVCLGGMASRASFISMLGIIFLGITISIYMHEKGHTVRKILNIIKYNLLILITVLAGIGWFYLRNIKLSGDWARTAPQSWAVELGREYRGLSTVLTSRQFWLIVPDSLYGKSFMSNSWTFNVIGSYIISIFIVIRAAFLGVKTKLKNIDKYDRAIYLLLLLQVMLLFGQQIVHAVGYGGYNIRYVMPMWASMGLLAAYSALSFSKLKGQLVTLAVVFGWLTTLASIINLHQSRWRYKAGWLEDLNHFVSDVNGLPSLIVPITLFGIALGIVLQSYALWHLSSSRNK